MVVEIGKSDAAGCGNRRHKKVFQFVSMRFPNFTWRLRSC